jgi:hypothetical protein
LGLTLSGKVGHDYAAHTTVRAIRDLPISKKEEAMRKLLRLTKSSAFMLMVVAFTLSAVTLHAAGKSASHGAFTPAEMAWKDGPASLPPGAKVVVLEGNPAEPGPFTIRLKFPDGYRIAPHWHPAVERVTVVAGTFHLGMGETFDQAKASTLPAGSFVFMAPQMAHFAWAEGETIVQLTGEGPWGITYLNAADDPRQMKKSEK